MCHFPFHPVLPLPLINVMLRWTQLKLHVKDVLCGLGHLAFLLVLWRAAKLITTANFELVRSMINRLSLYKTKLSSLI